MLELCKVVKVKGRWAFLKIDRHSGCDSCNKCAFNREKSIVVPSLNHVNAKVGDSVRAEMPDKAPVTASLVLYLIPVLFMAIGIGLGTLINVYAQIGFGFGALIISFGIIALIDKHYRNTLGYLPKIAEIDNSTAVETNASEVSAENDIEPINKN